MTFRIVGRADDMLIVKGVNVYPAAVQEALFKFRPEVSGHFRIMLDRPGPVVQPPLRLRVEYGSEGMEVEGLSGLEERIMAEFKSELRVAPKIEWVPPGTIPREKKKTRFIEVEASGGREMDDGS